MDFKIFINEDPTYPEGSQNTKILISDIKGKRIWSYYQYDGNNFIPENSFNLSSIPISVGVNLKYMGSVLSPSGLIYNIPGSADNVAIINPYKNTINTSLISNINFSNYPQIGNVSSSDKWTGGVLYKNNIYCVPQTSKAVLKINTSNNTISFINVQNLATSTYNWFGCALTTNNLIYGISHGNSNILRIEPETDTVTTIPISGSLSGSYYYCGGVLAPNGLVYGIPHDSTSVLVINPFNNTARADIVGLTGISSGSGKWVNGVLGQDGKIYGIPFVSNDILVIDPLTNTFSLLPSGLTGDNKFYGGTLGMDGKIYCTPHRQSVMLVINTTTNPATVSTVSGINFPVINDRWSGSILEPNGKIYFTAGTSSNFAIIKTSIQSYPPWMLSPHFNKF